MPFADYDSFEACERANSDKRDPGAYCAAIKRATEQLDGDPSEVAALSDVGLDAEALDELAEQSDEWVASDGVWIDTAEGNVIYQQETGGEEQQTDGFDVDVYRIVQTDDEGPATEGDILGVAVDMPNAGVYVDWNIDAWPDDEQLSEAHVSDYGNIDDLAQVTQGELEPIETVETQSLDGSVLVSGLSQEGRSYIERAYNATTAVFQQDIPDDAVNISDRSEAPADANVITGPRGGLYYVPEGGDGEGGEGDARPRSEIRDEIQDAVESGDTAAVSNAIGDALGVDTVELPRNMPDEQLVEFSTSLTHAAELGIGSTVERVHAHSGRDASGFYRYNDGTLSFNNNINESNFEDYVEEGDAVGDSVEWLALHELGHAEHDTTVDDMVNSEEFFSQGMAVSRDGEWVGRERVDLVDEEVSSYARTNPGEFVAEVYAGLALGEDFSDEVMDIYEEFSGPDSWQDYRGEQE